jgi:hypothetical protein
MVIILKKTKGRENDLLKKSKRVPELGHTIT